MHDVESNTIRENLSCGALYTTSKLARPNNTSEREKNRFIALTASASSVADGSM